MAFGATSPVDADEMVYPERLSPPGSDVACKRDGVSKSNGTQEPAAGFNQGQSQEPQLVPEESARYAGRIEKMARTDVEPLEVVGIKHDFGLIGITPFHWNLDFILHDSYHVTVCSAQLTRDGPPDGVKAPRRRTRASPPAPHRATGWDGVKSAG